MKGSLDCGDVQARGVNALVYIHDGGSEPKVIDEVCMQRLSLSSPPRLFMISAYRFRRVFVFFFLSFPEAINTYFFAPLPNRISDSHFFFCRLWREIAEREENFHLLITFGVGHSLYPEGNSLGPVCFFFPSFVVLHEENKSRERKVQHGERRKAAIELRKS